MRVYLGATIQDMIQYTSGAAGCSLFCGLRKGTEVGEIVGWRLEVALQDDPPDSSTSTSPPSSSSFARFLTSFQDKYVLSRLTFPRSSRIRNMRSSAERNRDERRWVRRRARVTWTNEQGNVSEMFEMLQLQYKAKYSRCRVEMVVFVSRMNARDTSEGDESAVCDSRSR